jgi:hypothetical protein
MLSAFPLNETHQIIQKRPTLFYLGIDKGCQDVNSGDPFCFEKEYNF